MNGNTQWNGNPNPSLAINVPKANNILYPNQNGIPYLPASTTCMQYSFSSPIVNETIDLYHIPHRASNKNYQHYNYNNNILTTNPNNNPFKNPTNAQQPHIMHTMTRQTYKQQQTVILPVSPHMIPRPHSTNGYNKNTSSKFFKAHSEPKASQHRYSQQHSNTSAKFDKKAHSVPQNQHNHHNPHRNSSFNNRTKQQQPQQRPSSSAVNSRAFFNFNPFALQKKQPQVFRQGTFPQSRARNSVTLNGGMQPLTPTQQMHMRQSGLNYSPYRDSPMSTSIGTGNGFGDVTYDGFPLVNLSNAPHFAMNTNYSSPNSRNTNYSAFIPQIFPSNNVTIVSGNSGNGKVALKDRKKAVHPDNALICGYIRENFFHKNQSKSAVNLPCKIVELFESYHENTLKIMQHNAQLIWLSSKYDPNRGNWFHKTLDILYPSMKAYFIRKTKMIDKCPNKEQIQFIWKRMQENHSPKDTYGTPTNANVGNCGRNTKNNTGNMKTAFNFTAFWNKSNATTNVDHDQFDLFFSWFDNMCDILCDLSALYQRKDNPLCKTLFWNRMQCTDALMRLDVPDGAFVLRLSTHSNGLAISFKYQNAMKHVLFTRIDESGLYDIGKTGKQTKLCAILQQWSKLQFLVVDNMITTMVGKKEIRGIYDELLCTGFCKKFIANHACNDFGSKYGNIIGLCAQYCEYQHEFVNPKMREIWSKSNSNGYGVTQMVELYPHFANLFNSIVGNAPNSQWPNSDEIVKFASDDASLPALPRFLLNNSIESEHISDHLRKRSQSENRAKRKSSPKVYKPPTMKQILNLFSKSASFMKIRASDQKCVIDVETFEKLYVWLQQMSLIVRDLKMIYFHAQNPLQSLFYSRCQCENILKSQPEGTFMFRLSSSNGGLAIVYVSDGVIKHNLLSRTEKNEIYQIRKTHNVHKEVNIYHLVRPWAKLKLLYTPTKLVPKKYFF